MNYNNKQYHIVLNYEFVCESICNLGDFFTIYNILA